ncbi:hypothetical protein [Clostridium phage Maintenon]|nr:hypothetical protein [Clostridium phage Maintenon]
MRTSLYFTPKLFCSVPTQISMIFPLIEPPTSSAV